jgi:hypothetical protein
MPDAILSPAVSGCRNQFAVLTLERYNVKKALFQED